MDRTEKQIADLRLEIANQFYNQGMTIVPSINKLETALIIVSKKLDELSKSAEIDKIMAKLEAVNEKLNKFIGITAHFYKKTNSGYRYIIQKNLETIPRIGEKVVCSNQLFVVKNIEFNIDKYEYNIYMHRV